MLYRTMTGAPVFGLRREIDRLFDDAFSRDGMAWSPAVDIKENENELRVEVELPGLKPEEVDITAENGILTVRGEKKSERKEGDENRFHLIERTYGSFERTFQLPQGVDESKIEAEFEHGLLAIKVPKAALPQPRRISISNRSGQKQGAVGNGSLGQVSNGSQGKNTSQKTAAQHA